jgi:predicted Zn-dependent protease
MGATIRRSWRPSCFYPMSARQPSILCAVLIAITTALGAQQELAPALAARFSEGVTALKAGSLDAAERAFRDVLKNGGDQPFVHHNLGIVLQQRGDHQDAIVEFRAASRLDPSFGPAPLLAGVSLLASGRPREAATELERAVRLMPEEPATHLQLADAYERTDDIAGVVGEYRRMVELVPASDEYGYRLGKAYLKLAQRSYERIRAINPRSARLSQALGSQYLEQNRPDLASRAFQQAAQIDPTLPEIHLALARIHLDEGRLDEAEVEVARERAIVPESGAARALQADIDAARKRR